VCVCWGELLWDTLGYGGGKSPRVARGGWVGGGEPEGVGGWASARVKTGPCCPLPPPGACQWTVGPRRHPQAPPV
jgi:hypothetical protein